MLFCLDGNNNIVISDGYAHKIKVFLQEGELLHTIGLGREGGYYGSNMGITGNNNMLICSFQYTEFGLLIFSAKYQKPNSICRIVDIWLTTEYY